MSDLADSDTTACVYPAHSEKDLEDLGQPHPARIGFLCRKAYRRLEQHLAEFPALVSWLHANLPSSSSSAPDPMRVASSDDLPVPVAVDIHDELQEIREVLRSWTQLVVEERDLHGPSNTRVSTSSSYLLTHLDWAAGQLWIDDLAREVSALHRDAYALVPYLAGRHRLDLPCTECQAQELYRTDGDDHVQCASCGQTWKEDRYRWLCKRVVREQEDASGWQLPDIVAAVHDLNPKTLRTWARRGLVASACAVLPGDVRDGRLRVHPDEIQALVDWAEAVAKRNAEGVQESA